MQKDFPDYYSYGVDYTSLARMFQIAMLNCLIFGTYFWKADYRAY